MGGRLRSFKKQRMAHSTYFPGDGSLERTFAWLYKCRRLCRDFEHLTSSVVGFIHVAMLRLLVRRLAPSETTS